MRTAAILIVFSLFVACKGAKSPEEQAVIAQSKLYETNPTDSTALALVKALSTYIEVHGTKDSTSARYILQAARLSTSRQQWSQALGFYKMYLVQYPDRPDQPDRLAEVIDIMDKLEKPELNQVLYRAYADRFKQDPRAKTYTAKITNPDVTIDSLLKHIGLQMFNDSIYRLNEDMARLYVDASEAAVMANPNMPQAAEYLHRAAETARTLRNIPKAITLYDWIIDKYPTDKRGATSLFLKAFTFDNDLKDYVNAKKYYEEFLAQYPDNEFTPSAKFLLENLGKSEEELKQILEKKSKENAQ
ncbi:MAG TPA: tetratricopeptide repeat protein [Saprospiraceae bacterium]|nr:tetratricopeptide repeat protein [Saprospiraceae bacterium]